MNLLVCGGRDFDDYEKLIKVLDKVHKRYGIEMLIEGGCKGADAHAAIWADNNKIFRVTAHANWMQFDKSAGPIRNSNMIKFLPIDAVVAFPGGRGTKDMIDKAKKAGLKVKVVK